MNASPLNIAGLMAVIVILSFFVFRRIGEPLDVQYGPPDYHFICPQDGTTMSWTAKEYRAFYIENYGKDVLCPDKGTPMIFAERCPHCRAYFQRGLYREHCPECGELFYFPPET